MIAQKFVNILNELHRQGKDVTEEFGSDHKSLIRLAWSVFQLEGVDFELDVSFLNDVDLTKLDTHHFIMYKQVLSFVQLTDQVKCLDEERIGAKFNELAQSELV